MDAPRERRDQDAIEPMAEARRIGARGRGNEFRRKLRQNQRVTGGAMATIPNGDIAEHARGQSRRRRRGREVAKGSEVKNPTPCGTTSVRPLSPKYTA